MLAAAGLHLVGPDHDTGGRAERRAAGVFEALARRKRRLFADDSGTTHVLNPANAVGDAPMPAAQLDGFAALVLDAHAIGPDKMPFDGRRLVLEKMRLHRHLDRTRRRRIHRCLQNHPGACPSTTASAPGSNPYFGPQTPRVKRRGAATAAPRSVHR